MGWGCHIFYSFNFMCIEPDAYHCADLSWSFMSCYYPNAKTQVELILTTEDLLRSIGWHRRFITGRKKIKPNFKSTTKSELAMEMENFNTCEKVIVRLIVWIYFGFKEFSYQLWGGQRYDTLEIIQETLNSNLVRYRFVWYSPED